MMIDRFSNVTAYGKSFKRVGGKLTDIKAHVFYVSSKTDKADRPIPKQIDGIATDVVEISPIKPLMHDPARGSATQYRTRPLRGGLRMTGELLESGAYGTLGAIVKDRVTGKLLGLTNAHVANNPVVGAGTPEYGIVGTAEGTKLYQPVTTDTPIGTVFKDKPRDGGSGYRNDFDASLLSIDTEDGVTVGIIGLTSYAQTFVSPDLPHLTEVYKTGTATGTTKAYLESADIQMSTDDGFGYDHQILLRAGDVEGLIADHGDSGSVVCVDLGSGRVGIIGLLHSSGYIGDEQIYVASRIDLIATHFDIVPWDGTVILDNSNGWYAALEDGTIYQKDAFTFLSITNQSVCKSGAYDELIRSECYSSLSIDTGSVVLVSGVSPLKKDLRIVKTEYIDTGNVDTDVELSITLNANLGVSLNVDVPLQVSLETETRITQAANVDQAVNLIIELESEAVNQARITGVVDTDVLLSITADIDTGQTFGVMSESNVFLNVACDCVSKGTYLSSVDADVIFSITAETTTDLTGTTNFSGEDIVLPSCGLDYTPDFSYGRC